MAEKKFLDESGLSHLKAKMDLTYAKKGEVGATDYNSLTGLPTLDGAEIKGAMTKEGLGIAGKDDIPTDNKGLTNGAGYQTAADVEGILTTKNYQTEEDVESAITEKGYQTASEVEEKITSKGYQTETEVTTAINKAVANINKKEVVTSTEEMTDENVIYLMANEGSGNNIYDEYILVNKKPEKIGTTEVDLSGYLKESDLTELSNEEIDAIFNS